MLPYFFVTDFISGQNFSNYSIKIDNFDYFHLFTIAFSIEFLIGLLCKIFTIYAIHIFNKRGEHQLFNIETSKTAINAGLSRRASTNSGHGQNFVNNSDSIQFKAPSLYVLGKFYSDILMNTTWIIVLLLDNLKITPYLYRAKTDTNMNDENSTAAWFRLLIDYPNTTANIVQVIFILLDKLKILSNFNISFI